MSKHYGAYASGPKLGPVYYGRGSREKERDLFGPARVAPTGGATRSDRVLRWTLVVLAFTLTSLLFADGCFKPRPAHADTFDFSIPHYKQRACCCDVDTTNLATDIQSVALYEYGQQSPTWVAHADSLRLWLTGRLPKSHDARWLPVWRDSVVVEAAPIQRASKSIAWSSTRDSLDYAATHGHAYYLVFRTATSAWSCRSNIVYR